MKTSAPSTFFFSILLSLNAFSQTPAIEWQKSLGGTLGEVAFSIQETTDGGFIVAGFSESNDGDVTGNYGGRDMWVVKLDGLGDLVWQKSLGGSSHDEALSIQETSDGGFIVAGFSRSIDGDVTGNHGQGDMWVVKLDGLGDLVWQKSLGGSSNDWALSIQETSDGGFIIAGFAGSIDGDVTGNLGGMVFWVVKLDVLGGLVWQKSLGGSSADWAYSIQETSDGGFIVAGETESNDGDVTGNHGLKDMWVVKLDGLGNLIWQKSLGGSSDDWAYSIQEASDGGFIVAGGTESNDGDVTGNHGSMDMWVVKLDSLGVLVWQQSLGGTSYENTYSIQVTVDGGLIVAGWSFSNDGDVTGNHGSVDFWVVKLDGLGNLIWQKSLGGSSNDWANSIQETSDGGFIVAGYSNSYDGDITGNHGVWDMWVVKLAITTGIEDAIEGHFSISPNPSNGLFYIELAELHDATLTITDVLGRVVLSKKINEQRTTIDLSQEPKGIYLVTMQTTQGKFSQKIVLE